MAFKLEDVSGIGKTTADRLRSAGIDDVKKLAAISVDDLIAIKGFSEAKANSLIENAKKLIESSATQTTSKDLKIQKETPSKLPIKKIEEKQENSVKSSKSGGAKPRTKISFKDAIKKQAECNIGLVGHVDHGKTTLVKALTGDWTDRHSEEQERGISIKLGYSDATILYCPSCNLYLTAYMAEVERQKGQSRSACPKCGTELEFKRNISFVDAPGHEILMATMLSGASLMDGACLLIAADEDCPQPQTREHLAALNIAGIKRIIIIQNKIDAVTREKALENHKQIKNFVKGTVAEGAPIIPISAVFGANLNLIVEAFEEIIPTPILKENEDFEFLVARSFDINRPGKAIEDLRGGVIGGSVLKGKVKIGDRIEIKPGLHVNNDYVPIKTTVVSISQGKNQFEEAKPGGLVGLGTLLDPVLTKGDSLIGQLVGKENSLPDVISEIELDIHLLDRVLGTENQIKIYELKHNEKLLLVVGTEKTAGTVSKIMKNTYVLSLNPPICPAENFIFAISRIINRRYRLIGYGIRVNGQK
ncbi:MAG: translation initiation factor IF-2 subunit gamma [Candidatus Lokiarchaeota archaeon]|nr:translation initiation factor IF-2 subunit gamma [Candidatus Lokiarchaeota archaeon]